jgi:hypothetical protein
MRPSLTPPLWGFEEREKLMVFYERASGARMPKHSWVNSSSTLSIRYLRPLWVRNGAPFYRNLFWEAGLVGQVLYLEAEEASIRSTGIGCYFDDPVHEVFGISSRDWQSFYHFTVGGAVEDKRLTTLPAYRFEEKR